MQTEIVQFVWPQVNTTASIVAVALALMIFVFGAFSGARVNKIRILFAVLVSTAIGWLAMPLALKAGSRLHLADTQTGEVILVTVMMILVAAVATNIYEIITVTFPDIGLSGKK